MNLKTIARKGAKTLVVAAGLSGLLALSPLAANAPDPSFGPVAYRGPPSDSRIKVEPWQIQAGGDPVMAKWRGYSSFPQLSSIQKRMIATLLHSGGEIEESTTAGKGGKPGGGGGGGGGGTTTVPYFERTIFSPIDSKTYTMSMVGADPFKSPDSVTTITYVPIILVATVGKTVYDPREPSACGDTTSVANRFFTSPLFASASYNSNGTTVSGQFANAFQRASFDSVVNGHNYAVNLSPSVATPIVVPVSLRGQAYNVTCQNGTKTTLAAISINTFDSAIQSVISQYSTPDKLPIVLTYNIVESQNGQCCILGYHSLMAVSGGVQTYATGAYVDAGIFSGTSDISVWTHEITEWLDDPFVQAGVAGGGSDDLTPAWGHTGQVSGCQDNLEVGDPLSGTSFAALLNGFTYHVQDLAFYDWFYRTPPAQATGTGHKFSMFGSFVDTQSTVCS